MKEKNNGKKKTIMIAAIVIAALLILAALFALVFLNREINRISFEGSGEEVPEIDPQYAAANGILFPTEETIHDPRIINVLFLGTDYQIENEERGRADSNILCSLDTGKGEIRLISFERGIGVPIPGRGSDLLTHAYSYGGPTLSQSIISQMFNVEINGYAQVDFQSFADIINCIGGVDVELTELEAQALNGAIPTKTWTWVEVHEGWNHLGGHDTLEYCRLRSVDSDWGRQRRQRAVLEQIQKACRHMSLPELMKLADTVMPMIHTNLSKEDVTDIIRSMPKLLRGSVTQLQVPDKNSTEGYIRCLPDYESKKIANFLYDAGYDITSPY